MYNLLCAADVWNIWLLLPPVTGALYWVRNDPEPGIGSTRYINPQLVESNRRADNSMAWLIVITGRPAAGKSMLATWLGKQLRFPFISKDGIKEILFDELGWSDREWSQKLGQASINLLYYFAHTLLMAGGSIILENTFRPDLASSKLSTLARQTNASALQIICNANNDVLYQRFKQRTESGLRHPGHVDVQSMPELRASLERYGPLRLGIGGEVIEVDTTDISILSYESILVQVKAIMYSAQPGNLHCTSEGMGNSSDLLRNGENH
jgi:predicted kinase